MENDKRHVFYVDRIPHLQEEDDLALFVQFSSSFVAGLG